MIFLEPSVTRHSPSPTHDVFVPSPAAIWMMPVREAYGNWPTSGEIDIVESRGNKDFRCGDGPQIGERSPALQRWRGVVMVGLG